MDLIKFLSLALVGSYLCQAYTAAISAILVLEEGCPTYSFGKTPDTSCWYILLSEVVEK